MQWREFKKWVEDQGVTDRMEIQKMREINPGNFADGLDVYISEDKDSFTID